MNPGLQNEREQLKGSGAVQTQPKPNHFAAAPAYSSWKRRLTKMLAPALLLAGGLALLAAAGAALARPQPAAPQQVSIMHPAFALLDAAGENVLDSGLPLSTLETCGQCHDTAFIAANTDHNHIGLKQQLTPGVMPEQSLTGSFDRPEDVEMNCLVCHTPAPAEDARQAALQSGMADWSAAAAWLGSGIVEKNGQGFAYNQQVFTEDGLLAAEFVQVQSPSNENCAVCHSLVHSDLNTPLVLPEPFESDLAFITSGTVISPQRMADSGANLAGKAALTRSFDIHAERGLQCTDCHYAANNPAYARQDGEQPAHLEFDPRRLETGEYLKQPIHQLGGQAGALRGCADCHDGEASHTWLPYTARHLQALSCETCHIPKVYGPALQAVDWTVLTAGGSPRIELRGVGLKGLVEGYQPAVLAHGEADVQPAAPSNLVTTWMWANGEQGESIPAEAITAAWFENGAYRPEIVQAFDEDGSGQIDESELALDSAEKAGVVQANLATQGYPGAQVVSQVHAYPLKHGVTGAGWATQDCRACHNEDSILTRPVLLANSAPLESDLPQISGGQVYTSDTGRVYFQADAGQAGLYVLGHSSIDWIDWFGVFFFTATLLGVAAHGGYRVLSAMRRPKHTPETKKVYMYTVYERLWHWLQTFSILGLLFTGLVIHKPDTFGIFSFRYVVLTHNILAAIVVLNAFLSLFYHLVSGEIRQYLPKPTGFIDQAILQARFYLSGIFKGEPHPFEKTPEKKLNPLQQLTYFGLLNVLLPLQVVTGILMWGAQRWPDLTARLGGLGFLAPFHTLISWMLAAFVVAHVYLTTTGHAPLGGIQAMMMGWDEVEQAVPAEEGES